ncbi:MAG: DeoR/GlpR family DNA-binding transcription regulator [Phycisphaerae bacterium]|nr:DeoR/GlpR family DNA-binding transcription regulator [Phycisphaerae bacterium]
MRDRQQKIVEYVQNVGLASFADLAGMFNVSPFTIRRDVDYLAKSRLIARIKGGAQRIETPDQFREAGLPNRMQTNYKHKEIIARNAMDFLQSGDSIFLDGSSTVSCLARSIAQADLNITVVTNSVLIVMELAQANNVRVMGLGGIFDRETYSFTDFESVSHANTLYINKAFFSCTGLVPNEGTYENAVFNRNIKRLISKRSSKVILLLDSSKINRPALNHTFKSDEIDILITEKKLPDKESKILTDNGIEIIIAK